MARPPSEEARRKAIQTAVELLADAGIEGFSVEEVARRSGVAKTTLYRHWSSAGDLLTSAIDGCIEHVASPDTGSLRGDLLALFHSGRCVLNAQGNRQLFLDLLAAAARDPELAERKRTMVGERLQPIREILERATARGEIPETPFTIARYFIHGPVMAKAFLDDDPIDEDEVTTLVDLIVRGLGGR